MDVSDRSLQVLLTQQAKILTSFLPFVRIFAFAGFVRGLKRRIHCGVFSVLSTGFPYGIIKPHYIRAICPSGEILNVI